MEKKKIKAIIFFSSFYIFNKITSKLPLFSNALGHPLKLKKKKKKLKINYLKHSHQML